MSLLFQYFPQLDFSGPPPSFPTHPTAETADPSPSGGLPFDPEIFFKRTVTPEAPRDQASIAGRIRGPAGGSDAWEGRSVLLPMSRTPQCIGYFSNIVTNVSSTKMNGVLGTEAGRETAFAKLFEFAPNVKNARTQGQKRFFRLFNRRRWTIPDVEIDLHEGPLHLIEIKPESVAQSPEIQMRTYALQCQCAREGIVYGVLTETYILRQPRFGNVCLLRRYRHGAITASDWSNIVAALASGPLAIAMLRKVARTHLPIIYAALHRGHLHFDLDSPISAETPVWIP